MAKKQSPKKTTARRQPTFVVRFIAPGLSPGKIPLRAVTDALAAVQDLASGRNRFETPKVPHEKTIGLVDVRTGSAIYECVAHAPKEALSNFGRVATILSHSGDEDAESGVVATLGPIEDLSNIARTVGCRLEVATGYKAEPIFTVEREDYHRIASKLLMTGETTIIGNIKRVGGATGMKCLLRVPGRRKMLYCKVQTRALIRNLGQHLYEDIVAVGEAVWIHRSWYVYRFTIRDFSQPKLGKSKDAIAKLRDAGLSAWDKISDPGLYIEELRQ